MEPPASACDLRCEYIRAERCWRTNNLKSCLLICDALTRVVEAAPRDASRDKLRQLVKFLKIQCLADDYFLDESLLLNEDDIEAEDQLVKVYTGNQGRGGSRSITSRAVSRGTTSTAAQRTAMGGELAMNSRARTGVLTGKMPSATSRHGSGRATSSYRPLTTNLTASQTAFSKSTRPLLKYSTNQFLSKPMYEYLYNTQTMSNRCPDYRQCLEYLNLVQGSLRKKVRFREVVAAAASTGDSSVLVDLGNQSSTGDSKRLGLFWSLSFGVCYYNLHMIRQAEDYFRMGAAAEPHLLDCYTWLVKVHLRTNQVTSVLKTCELGLRHCKSPLLYNWSARVQSLMGNVYAANASLRRSLEFFPTNLEALSNVGYFAFYGDKLEQALKCYKRIYQLSFNRTTSQDVDSEGASIKSMAELFNNLAVCNFYNGQYHKVFPMFTSAFLAAPDREVTSDIWYNISFIPMSLGFDSLAVACLRLALKNNSQNEEAINNLGVLLYGRVINDELHFENRQELWGSTQVSPFSPEVELKNMDDQDRYISIYDKAESHFRSPMSESNEPAEDERETALHQADQPEMLYNMAMVKRARGDLLAAVKYCNMYLARDPNNYSIRSMILEIRQLVAHDA